jgi:hypothetical protein
MFTTIFGIVLELIQMSAKDNLERKEYMGLWRCVSELMAKMMSRLPSTVTKYIDRNTP